MSQNYKINLFQHQIDVINSVKDKKNVGLFLDLGLGKTITSTVLALIFDNPKTLIVCPKPLIDGWKQTLRDFFKITICDFKDIANKIGHLAYFLCERLEQNIRIYVMLILRIISLEGVEEMKKQLFYL